jgi:hypothetical protein
VFLIDPCMRAIDLDTTIIGGMKMAMAFYVCCIYLTSNFKKGNIARVCVAHCECRIESRPCTTT